MTSRKPANDSDSNSASDSDSESEQFCDSLDRILSSSASSTSASDTETPTSGRRRRSPPPPPLDSLDVWISSPSSVADRRRRLLLRLGLSADSSFSRLKSLPHHYNDEVVAVAEHAVATAADVDDVMAVTRCEKSRSRSGDVISPVSKPQFHRLHQRSIHFPVLKNPGETLERSRALSDGALGVSMSENGGEAVGIEDSVGKSDEGAKGEEDKVGGCLIKDLDNGKEFVVNQLREDGVSNKVRDVKTGKSLTIEEFGLRVGSSPIVQELMRRHNVNIAPGRSDSGEVEPGKETKGKKKGGWLRNIKNAVAEAMVNHQSSWERWINDDRDTSLEKGGVRSSLGSDDSPKNGLRNANSKRIKVRHYGKSQKELSCLFMNQEIEAHNGSIWSMKFSLDGRYLASAGEDCVIHLWEVVEVDQKGDSQNEKASEDSPVCNPFALAVNKCSPDLTSALGTTEGNRLEKKRNTRVHTFRKYLNSEPLMVPEHVFALSEKPVITFTGHQDDILDLSWSKSLHLLSSSMDKTVRLWHMSSKTCLKTFLHSDYVTCIQFNPFDDRYFISGSLDEKVRIWSIPDRQIVDWNDLHEMVTAVCYAPDGQCALVGSHKGSCHLYDTSDNKLLQKSQIEPSNKKKKSRLKKITGFQFAPGSSTKVLITSADSRIRLVDGEDLVHKFKGFRNTSSQISAHFTPNGKYLICASEDSNVYLWRYEDNCRTTKGVASVTQSYEQFFCEGVTVAIPWSAKTVGEMTRTNSNSQNGLGESQPNSPTVEQFYPSPVYKSVDGQHSNGLSPKAPNSNRYNDRVSATWPEELVTNNKQSPRHTPDLLVGGRAAPSRSAWGLVIVTAGRDGEIRIFQNYGFPVRM